MAPMDDDLYCPCCEQPRRVLEKDLQTVGSRLRSVREVAGLTLDQLGSRTGISPVSIKLYEHGVLEQPYTVLAKLVEAIGFPLEAVLSTRSLTDFGARRTRPARDALPARTPYTDRRVPIEDCRLPVLSPGQQFSPRAMREAIDATGTTIYQLAARLGLGRPQVSGWANGRNAPKPSSAARIAATLGIEPELLYEPAPAAVSA